VIKYILYAHILYVYAYKDILLELFENCIRKYAYL